MIDNKESVYFTHENLLKDGREFVKSYRLRYKRDPSSREYNRVLLDWLNINEMKLKCREVFLLSMAGIDKKQKGKQ
jgi:hypothetical protein